MKIHLPTHFPNTEGRLTELFASVLNKKLDSHQVGLNQLDLDRQKNPAHILSERRKEQRRQQQERGSSC